MTPYKQQYLHKFLREFIPKFFSLFESSTDQICQLTESERDAYLKNAANLIKYSIKWEPLIVQAEIDKFKDSLNSFNDEHKLLAKLGMIANLPGFFDSRAIFWQVLENSSELVVDNALVPLVESVERFDELNQKLLGNWRGYAERAIAGEDLLEQIIEADQLLEVILLATENRIPKAYEARNLNKNQRQNLRAKAIVFLSAYSQRIIASENRSRNQGPRMMNRSEEKIPRAKDIKILIPNLLAKLSLIKGGDFGGDALIQTVDAILELDLQYRDSGFENNSVSSMLNELGIGRNHGFSQSRQTASCIGNLYHNLIDIYASTLHDCFPEKITDNRKLREFENYKENAKKFARTSERKLALGLAIAAYDSMNECIKREDNASLNDRRSAVAALQYLRDLNYFSNKPENIIESLVNSGTLDYRELLVEALESDTRTEEKYLRELMLLLAANEPVSQVSLPENKLPSISTQERGNFITLVNGGKLEFESLSFNGKVIEYYSRELFTIDPRTPLSSRPTSDHINERLADLTRQTIAIAEVAEIQFSNDLKNAPEESMHPQEVFLDNGSSIVGSNFRGSKEGKLVEFSSSIGSTLQCTQNDLSACLFKPITEIEKAKFKDLLAEDRPWDILLLRNKNNTLDPLSFPVIVKNFEGNNVNISIKLDEDSNKWEEKTIPIDRLAGIIFTRNNETSDNNSVKVRTGSGIHVGSTLKLTDNLCILGASEANRVQRIPRDEVYEIEFSSPTPLVADNIESVKINPLSDILEGLRREEIINLSSADPIFQNIHTRLTADCRNQINLRNPRKSILTVGSQIDYNVPTTELSTLNLQVSLSEKSLSKHSAVNIQVFAKHGSSFTTEKLIANGVITNTLSEIRLNCSFEDASIIRVVVLADNQKSSFGTQVEIEGSFR